MHVANSQGTPAHLSLMSLMSLMSLNHQDYHKQHDALDQRPRLLLLTNWQSLPAPTKHNSACRL